MSRSCGLLVLQTSLAFMLLAYHPSGQEPLAVAVARRPLAKGQDSGNSYGGPLPAGALRRLGTPRFLHGSEVCSLAFSPDGKILATTHFDWTVRFWRVGTGQEAPQFTGHADKITCVAFSPDGKTLATGSHDHTVRLWMASTGKELRRFQGHTGRITSLAYAPDGQTLVSASEDRTLRLWEVDTGTELRQLRGHREAVQCVAFSPDGKSIASGSGDSTLRFWEVATGRQIRCRDDQGSIDCLAFAPHGKTLAARGTSTLFVWIVATGKIRRQFTKAHYWHTKTVAFARDGKLASSGEMTTLGHKDVRLWDVSTKKLLRQFISKDGYAAAATFSPDSKILAGSVGKTIYLWETATGKVLQRFHGHRGDISALAFSPNGKMLASASADATVLIWDVERLRQREK